VRHRRGALLAGMEVLLRLAHLAALQVTHLGRQPLHRAGGDGQGAEESGMAVAWDHLRGHRLHREA
jgi:hypothetical protein